MIPVLVLMCKVLFHSIKSDTSYCNFILCIPNHFNTIEDASATMGLCHTLVISR